MTIEEAEDKLSRMNFDSIVKSYCNKVNYIEHLKSKIEELSKLHQPTVISAVCDQCRFNNAKTYHDKMWCRDCQQKNHFEQTDL